MTATFDDMDLRFQLFDVAEVEGLFAQPRFASLDRSSVDSMLDVAGALAARDFAPHAAAMDADEPRFENGTATTHAATGPALEAYRAAGFWGASFDEADGGAGLPETVAQAIAFIFSTANISLAGYPLLTTGSARLIASFGNADQKARYLAPMVTGRFTGTMCLSEPQAGSSLSDITTRAVPQPDGTYRISGRKMWISGGDHQVSENIIHLVLAKIPGGPAGVRGISLFIVPKYRINADGRPGTANDVALAGLNHKMGYRGLPNCALNFGDQGDCVGELVGEAHHGLGYMFQMMNEARIGVGLGATAIAAAGYRASLDYARERPQGRHPDGKDPTAPQERIIAHADVRRLLLAQKAAIEPSLALTLYCAMLVDRQHTEDPTSPPADKALLLDLLTPIAKSWPSEFCLEANRHAIQVLGGAGYTRDYPVERLYRDNRLNAIHEGTHGIQGLDLLGRKVFIAGGRALDLLRTEMLSDLRVAPLEVQALRDTLAAALDQLIAVTRALAPEIGKDPRRGLANATLYLDAAGHIVMGWMWVRIVTAAARRDRFASAFTRGKLQAALYFEARELSRVPHWLNILRQNDQSAFDMDADWF